MTMMMMIKNTAPARTPAKIATGNSSLCTEAPGLTSAVVSRTGPDVEACGCVGVANGEPPLTDKKHVAGIDGIKGERRGKRAV